MPRWIARTLILFGIALLPDLGAQTTAWTVTPVPVGATWTRSWFNDVSALAPNDAWAVGFYDAPYSTFNSDTYTLAMHWDGVAWTQTPTPSPSPYPGGTAAYLRTVAMVAPNDVWAAGEADGAAGGQSSGAWVHFQHWDGSAWSVVPGPTPPGGSSVNFSGTRVYESVAFAANDVWFGGQWAEPSPAAGVIWRPLAAHWDGTSITVFPTPAPIAGGAGFGIHSMSALGPNDIWAACRRNVAGGDSTLNVILHWDGSTWSQLSVPAATTAHTLREIVALASNDVWVFGDTVTPYAPYVLHFDGTSWTTVTGAPFAECAIAAAGSSDVLIGRDVVSNWNGQTSTIVDSFPGAPYPLLYGLSTNGAGGFFGVGRDLGGPGLSIRPFAAFVTVPQPPTAIATVRPPCTSPAPPQSLSALNLPIIGQTIIICAGDPSNTDGLTPLTTQSYLLFSAYPSLAGPCGIPIPGMGIGSNAGELLVDVGAGLLGTLGPVPLPNFGSVVCHTVAIPAIPALAGFTIFCQGALIDLTGPTNPGVLTDGLDLTIGY